MHINSSAPQKKKKKISILIQLRRCQAKIKLALALKSHGVLSQQLFCFLLKKKKTLLFSGLFKEEFLSLLIQILFI